jgi:hypothetical protein
MRGPNIKRIINKAYDILPEIIQEQVPIYVYTHYMNGKISAKTLKKYGFEIENQTIDETTWTRQGLVSLLDNTVWVNKKTGAYIADGIFVVGP